MDLRGVTIRINMSTPAQANFDDESLASRRIPGASLDELEDRFAAVGGYVEVFPVIATQAAVMAHGVVAAAMNEHGCTLDEDGTLTAPRSLLDFAEMQARIELEVLNDENITTLAAALS